MKKILCVILVIVMALMLIGCATNDSSKLYDVIVATPDGGYITGKATSFSYSSSGYICLYMENGTKIGTHIENVLIFEAADDTTV